MTALETVALSDYRPHIEAALSYAGGTHRYEDVAEMVAAGTVQFWPGPASCIVTETVVHPRKTLLNFFLAAGNRVELEAMEPLILDWGRSQGCSRAFFYGRKGWERSFLTRLGWVKGDHIVMEKDL